MLVATCLLAASLTTAAAQESAEGVWIGLARGGGDPGLTLGLPATLWLAPGADGALSGKLRVQGMEVAGLEVVLDAEGGALSLTGAVEGNAVEVTATIAGDSLAGEVSGMGRTLSLEARRIAREVLREPPAQSSPRDLDELDEEAWREDLAFLAAYLPQVHANAFHTRSQEEWEEAVAELDERLVELIAPEVAVELARLVASIGDAHTELNWREPRGFGAFPVELTAFAEGIFVTGVDERWAGALRARVVRVGSTPAEEALAEAATVFCAENPSWRKVKGAQLLSVAKLLWVLRVIDSRDELPLTLEDSGGATFEVAIERTTFPRLRRAPDPGSDPLPLWRTRTGEGYWFEPMPDRGAVYFAYNRCAETPGRPMADFVTEVLAAVAEAGAERLVIDLRNNSGGDSGVLSRHLGRLKEVGRVIALIGPHTYSSGMMNAHQLREHLGATLVGEPTGGKPNSFGELRWFRLPRSGLQVFYSTKYFRMLAEDPPAVEPEVLVELTAADHFAGRDPVLERALDL